VLQANLSGKVIDAPAGAIQFAVGAEYRQEESEAISDPLTAQGLNSSNAIPNVIGEFDVTEVYGELDIPLVADSFVNYIGLAVAGRLSDYSTVGTTGTIESRLTIKPVDNLTFRGSLARAVRAPNVGELFNPGSQTFAQVSDPCNGITAASTGIIADNCRSNADIAARIASTGAFTLTQSELQGTTGFIGGNPNLAEEEANTFTVGLVYIPEFLPESLNASITLDYFDIEVEDAIFAISQNNVLNLCFESVGLEVNSGSANVGSIATSGVDLAVNLDWDSNALPGTFNFTTAYTFLDEYEVVNLPNTPADNEAGEIGNAENRWTSSIRYTTDKLSVQLQVRFIGESRIEDQDFDDETCATIECVADAVVYSDIQARYSFGESSFAGGRFEVFGGIRNMFDEEGPLLPAGLTDGDTGVGTNGAVYDAIGRSLYVGGKVKF